jgi:hypothetical protein
MFNTYKIVGDRASVINHDAFSFYKDRAQYRDKKIINENRHYAKIISSIYEKIANDVVQYEGGVYAKGMFYIIPQPYPKKMFIKVTNGKELKGTMNLHTNGKVCSIFFVNLFSKTKYKCWDMYNGFFKSVTKKFSDFLKSDSPKYIFSLDSIFNIKKR